MFSTATGAIVIAAQNNVTYTVPVTLTVTQPTVLYVSPASMSRVHQKGSAFTAPAVSVMSEGGTLNWTATIDSPVFAISLSSGSTPGSVGLILADPAGISEGIYSASLTVSTSGATIAVPVSVQVVVAGTIEVKMNIEAASFTITGPTSLLGSGLHQIYDAVKEGSYTIEFDHVQGYRKPRTLTFDTVSGKTVTIDVQYQQRKPQYDSRRERAGTYE